MTDPTVLPAAASDARAAAANVRNDIPPLPAGENAAANAAIKVAQNLPQLVEGLETASPTLAARLTTEEVSIHTSPLGGLACSAVAAGVAYYGLVWPPEFVSALVAGAALFGSYALPFAVTLFKKV